MKHVFLDFINNKEVPFFEVIGRKRRTKYKGVEKEEYLFCLRIGNFIEGAIKTIIRFLISDESHNCHKLLLVNNFYY